jgi:hypothetical protein
VNAFFGLPESLQLLMPVRDPAFGQIVWGEFHGYAVPGKYANAVAAEFTGEVGENGAIGVQLNTEQAAWELFDYGSGHFNAIFFTHRPLNW